MNSQQMPVFEIGPRLPMAEAIELTLQSLRAYSERHEHWAVAWSGGKDSSATLTFLVWAIETGQIPSPRTLTVIYADTRQELIPLSIAAHNILNQLGARGIATRVAMASMDKRFLVYILGRGVPPPNNQTFRWCTRQIKVDPMTDAIAETLPADGSTLLMITGVRQGESAIRDRRIEMSCSKDGAECGQGWYQQVLPEAKGVRGRIATLAPLLHWRVCHVWDWLKVFAPAKEYGSWWTGGIADAYGGDEAEEINARTGCVGCPLAQKEQALEAILRQPRWAYLAPLRRLKPIYRELRQPHRRLKKTGYQKDGSLAKGKNKQRGGPLTLEARRWALGEILDIQAQCNDGAARLGMPLVDILNPEEHARIVDLIEAGTWPDHWEGNEPTMDTPMDMVLPNGWVQPILWGA